MINPLTKRNREKVVTKATTIQAKHPGAWEPNGNVSITVINIEDMNGNKKDWELTFDRQDGYIWEKHEAPISNEDNPYSAFRKSSNNEYKF